MKRCGKKTENWSHFLCSCLNVVHFVVSACVDPLNFNVTVTVSVTFNLTVRFPVVDNDL